MKRERIAIIGAGISGLTAAHTLKKMGYQNIVIYEARDRVGGKVMTVQKQGRFYEIGGVFVQGSFSMVKELLSEFNEPLTKKTALKTAIWQDNKLQSSLLFIRPRFGVFKIAKDFFKLWRLLTNAKNLGAPDMANSEETLYPNFNALSKNVGIESIPPAIGSFVTGMGFGHVDRTPALYQLKLMNHALGFALAIEMNNLLGLNIPGTFYVKNGYQSLFEKMANNFDVRLNTPIKHVLRDSENPEQKITIATEHSEEKFDKLIIATPPSDMVRFLDMDEEEAPILKNTKHFYFRSTLFLGKNLPKGKMVFFPESNVHDSLGLVNSLYNWHPENDYFSTYQLYDESISKEKLDAELLRTVAELGGTIEEIVVQESFNYFPHFYEEELREQKPYEKLAAMQGRKNTYYIGAVLASENVNDAAIFAKNTMQKYF